MQANAPGDEPVKRPAGDTEKPQLLARRWIHGQAVGVVSIALRAAHFFGVAIAPYGALAKKPVRPQPCTREHDRRPPREAEKYHRAGNPADHQDHLVRDEVEGDRQRRPSHAEVEVAGYGEIAGELWILEVPYARRANASLREPVIQPRRSAVAEIGADRCVNWREHLKQHEHQPNKRKRASETGSVLDCIDQHAHRDRERRR